MSRASDVTNKLKEVWQGLADSDRPRNKQDLFVLAIHCVMLLEGFRCVGLSEHDDPRELADQTSIPSRWNSNRDSFCFKYRHSRSAMTFILKFLTLGDDFLVVHGMSIEDQKPVGMDLKLSEFVTTTSCSASSVEIPPQLSQLDSYFQNLDKLVTLVRLEISRKLVPCLIEKEGFEESAPTLTTQQQQPRQPTPSSPQPVQPPRRPPEQPHPPDVDPLRVGPIRTPPIFPFHTGDEDLMPSDVFPLYVPHRGRGPAFPGGHGGNGGGGMHVGPTHPGFGPGVRDPYATGPPGGGIPGGIPPGSVPPGARFDPFGPPGVGRGGMPPGPGGGGRGTARRGPDQGNPDPDEMPPPGSDDDVHPYWM